MSLISSKPRTSTRAQRTMDIHAAERPNEDPHLPEHSLARTNVLRGCDALSTAVITYGLPLLVLTSTGSTVLTGAAFATEWIPRLASIATGGTLIDRYGAGRVFRAASIARTVLIALALPVLTFLPTTGWTAITVVLALGAACGTLAELSFLAVETISSGLSLSAGPQAHRVQVWQLGIEQGALLVGPLIGGLLLLLGGPAMLSSACLLSLAAALAQPRRTTSPGPAHSSSTAGLRTGWRTLRTVPALGFLVAAFAASNLAVGVVQASTPITVTRTFAHSTATCGAIWSAAGVATLAATTICRRLIDRYGLWLVGAAAAALDCASCLFAAFAPSLPVYTVLIATLMAAEGVMAVVLRTMRTYLIPPHAYASTLSVTVLCLLLPMPAAGLLVTVLPAHFLPGCLACCALLQGAALAWGFAGLRRSPAARPAPIVAAALHDDAPQPL